MHREVNFVPKLYTPRENGILFNGSDGHSIRIRESNTMAESIDLQVSMLCRQSYCYHNLGLVPVVRDATCTQWKLYEVVSGTGVVEFLCF